MTLSKRMPLVLIIFVSSFLALSFLYGCIQPSQAQRCAPFSGAEKDKCLNETAIWYQEPYICYSIEDTTFRRSCLEKSVDPQEAQKMQAAVLYGQNSANEPARILPALTPSKPPQAANGTGAPQAGNIDAQISDCQKTQNLSMQACVRVVAIANSNMGLCANITDDDYRSSCISNIALSSKDPAQCGLLTRSGDANICKYYTSGG